MSGSNIADGPVHPTFLYESLWNLCLFFFLIWFRKRKKINGEVFFLYMSLYGAGRFWIESLRTDSLMLGGFRISQILAFLFALGFIIIFLVMRMKAAQNGTLDVEVAESKYGALLKTLKDEEENTAEEKNEAEKSSVADTTEQKTEENENK
jgi:phosphatidylglycerol:prolipoprotein diacylglycerol transferase